MKCKIRFMSILFFILVSLFSNASLTSASNVSGSITRNTIWTLANSPYIVTDDIVIYEQLTIEPGVVVKFDSGKSIVVGNLLIACGENKNRIIFTSNSEAPAPGDWESIRFLNASTDYTIDNDGNYISGCQIQYCQIEYAQNAIRIERSSPFICGNIIENNSDEGISISDGSPYIYDNTIMSNVLRGISISDGSPNIYDNTINNNGSRGISISGGSPNITGNLITDNLGTGINLSYSRQCQIVNNLIKNNFRGVYVYSESSGESSGILFANNTIEDNSRGGAYFLTAKKFSYSIFMNNLVTGNTTADEGGGVYLASDIVTYNIITNNVSTGNLGGGLCIAGLYDEFKFNNIYNNTGYDAYMYIDVARTASNNYWGTTQKGLISANIFDYYDDIELGKIIYHPIATEPFPGIDFSIAIDDIEQPNIISFQNHYIGSFKSVEWDFGDGTSSSTLNPIHTYDATGDYTVVFTVTEHDDQMANHMKTISVQVNLDSDDIDDDGDGFTENQEDCDDNDATVFPGAIEICGDGIDQNCDGKDESCTTNTPPAPPTGVRASDGTASGKVQVTWNSASGATAYDVYRADMPAWTGTAPKRIASSISGASYDDTTALSGNRYYYWVKARNSGGVSKYSMFDAGYWGSTGSIPSVPTNVSASDGTVSGKVNITWNATSNTLIYEIWRADIPAFLGGSIKKVGTSDSTSYSDTTAVNGNRYYYWVKARNSWGVSRYSKFDTGYTGTASSPLPAPTGVSATDGTVSGKVDITWSAVSGSIVYEVWRATDLVSGGGKPVRVGYTSSTSLSDTSGTRGMTYYYWVKSRDSWGASRYSVPDTGYYN